MACHGNHNSPATTSTGSARHGMGWMALLMAICCLAPLAAIVAIGVLGISVGGLLNVAAVLLCPLMMVFMLLGMGHGHGGRAKESPAPPVARSQVKAD